MKGGFDGFLLLAVLVLVAVVLSNTFFTVSQVEQALVLRFGEPVAGRGLITTPGLHAKIPFLENVVFIDKRILDLETPKQDLIASDNQKIEVDAFLRYHIVDPLKYYQTNQTLLRLQNQLGSVLDSSVRRVLGAANLQQIVRDDRAALMLKIRELVNNEASRLGVAVNDVRIRHADLPKEISEQVFLRMQSERQREAADFRAQGSEQAQTIQARADRDVVVLRADAQQKADTMRGAGDAERNQIFAEAFGKDPDFFAFYRSMQAYEAGFKSGDTRMILNPKSEFFRYFVAPSGKAAEAK